MSDDEHEDIDDEDELYDEEDGEIDDIDVADDNDNQKECLNWLLKEGGKSRYSGSGYRGSITDFYRISQNLSRMGAGTVIFEGVRSKPKRNRSPQKDRSIAEVTTSVLSVQTTIYGPKKSRVKLTTLLFVFSGSI
jgi:hypothetical protein